MIKSINCNLPPSPYLRHVLAHCPKSGLTYLDLWEKRDENNRLSIQKKEVKNEYNISLAKFNHDVLLLVKEGLVSRRETQLKIILELVDYDEDFGGSGYTLC